MLYYDEVFLSIQGESTDAGIPTAFIRLWGCPIGCSYCDTHQDKSQKTKASIRTLVNKVKRMKGIHNVCITGGEPLIYTEDLMPLVYELQYEGYQVSIETSGCMPIESSPYQRSYKYIMDVKCPSSGVVEKNIYENLLKLQPRDNVVFVIADRTDYEFARSVMQKYPTVADVLFSPVFDENNKPVIGSELVKWMLEDRLFNCRMQVQMHKILGVV